MDYSSILDILKSDADNLKKKFGAQYNRALNYYSLKNDYAPLEQVGISSDSMYVLDNLYANASKLKGYKGYNDAFTQYYDQVSGEINNASAAYSALSKSRAKASTLTQYGIQPEYSNSYEDKIAKLAGVAPSSFNVNEYLKDLPEGQYDTSSDEGISAVLDAYTRKKNQPLYQELAAKTMITNYERDTGSRKAAVSPIAVMKAERYQQQEEQRKAGYESFDAFGAARQVGDTQKQLDEASARVERLIGLIDAASYQADVDSAEKLQAEYDALIGQIIPQLQSDLRGQQQNIAGAEQYLRIKPYYALPEQEDFEEYAAKGKEYVLQDETVWNQNVILSGYENKGKTSDIGTKDYDQFNGQYSYMTEEEYLIWNFLYAKDKESGVDPNSAQSKSGKFISDLEPELTARSMGQRIEDAQKYAEEYPAVASISSILQAPAANLQSTLAYAEAGITSALGGEADFNDPSFGMAREQQAIRQEVSSDMSDVGSFFYNTGMSIGDYVMSLGAMGGSQAAMLSTMGGNAATSTTLNAIDSGATPDQALQLGLIAGAAEVIFEKVSLDSLIKMSGSGARAALIKNILKQSGIEGSEELFTEIANIVADLAIRGDASQYKNASASDIAIQLAQAFAGGALSGGIMGGGATAFSNAQNKTEQIIPDIQNEEMIIPEPIQQPVQARTSPVEQTNIQSPAAIQNAPQTGAQGAVENELNDQVISGESKPTKLTDTIRKGLGMETADDVEFAKRLEELNSTYQTTDNATQRKVAKQFVTANFEQAERYIKSSEVLNSPADAAIASEIIDRYRQTGRADDALSMIRQMAVKFSRAGQNVQSAAIWSKATPEGTVKAVEVAINKANKKLSAKNQYTMSAEQSAFIMDTVERTQVMNAQELSDEFIKITEQRGRKTGKSTTAVLNDLVVKNDVDTLKDIIFQNITLSVMDNVKRTIGQKISTIQAFSHLINPRTAIRNIFSNTAFRYQELFSDISASVIDRLMAIKTGQRTVGAPSIRPSSAKQNAQASKQFSQRANFEIQTGVDLNGEGKYDLFRSETFTKGALNKLERLIGYELRTPDQFAKGAVEISEIRKQLAIQGKDVKGKSIDELYEMADDETVRIAKEQALYNTFQDNSLPAKVLTSLKATLNKIGINQGDFGLGDLLLKYTKVPGNLMARSIDYTPLGALKVLKYLGTENITRTQQRDIAKTFGRSITGTMISAVGYLLTKIGIIVGAGDDDKEQKAQNAIGLTGRRINISAIGRLLNGESTELQEGDRLVSFDFLETINVPLSLGYELAKANEQNLSVGQTLANLGDAFAGEILDLPTMYIINSMVYEGMSDDASFFTIASIPFTQAIPGFIPAPIRQLASSLDPSQRERDGFIDNLIYSIPGARQTLEERTDVFGNPIQNSGYGVGGYFNPGTTTTYTPYEFTEALQQLYDKYGDDAIYPTGKIGGTFTVNGIDYSLTPEEQVQLQKDYGAALEAEYQSILSSSMGDAEKIDALVDAQSDIRAQIREEYAFSVNPPLEGVDKDIADILTALYDDTGDNKYLLNDNSFTYNGTEYEYPADMQNAVVEGYTPEYGDEEELDGLSDVVNSAWFKQEDADAQEKIVRDTINDILNAIESDTVREVDPLAWATKDVKPDTETYYGFNDYWKVYGTTDKIITALDEWKAYPVNTQTFTDQDMAGLDKTHEWTSDEQEQIADTTYQALQRYYNRLDAASADKIIDRVYLEFKNAIIDGRTISQSDILNAVYDYMNNKYEWS